MAKWKLFSILKKDETIEPKETVKEETQVVIEEESEDKPLVEHSETLESASTSKKKSSTTNPPPSDQKVWRNVGSIEEKVDNLHISRAQKPVTELDKAVDKLVEKKKKK